MSDTTEPTSDAVTAGGTDAGIDGGIDAGAPRRGRTPAIVAVLVGVVVAVLIGVLATRQSAEDKVGRSPLVGRLAPEIEGTAVVGQSTKLSDLAGKYVLLNFFATWCVPCQKEHPELVKFEQRHAAAGDAAVLAVVYTGDNIDDVKDFFAKRGGGWPVLQDDRAVVDYGVAKVPESFLIDPNGYVLGKLIGGVTDEGLERVLAQAKQAKAQ